MFVLGGIFIYNLTRTEEWITQEYLKHDITSPSDLTFEKLSSVFEVNVYRFPMSARYDVFDGQNFIVIDSRSCIQNQREQFYHELCHVIFHGGHQSNMYEPYRELLEWEADIFLLYAALPFHIIKQYDFRSTTLLYDLSTDFGVSHELCEKRLLQIRNRIQQNYSLVAERTILYNQKEDKTNG